MRCSKPTVGFTFPLEDEYLRPRNFIAIGTSAGNRIRNDSVVKLTTAFQFYTKVSEFQVNKKSGNFVSIDTYYRIIVHSHHRATVYERGRRESCRDLG